MFQKENWHIFGKFSWRKRDLRWVPHGLAERQALSILGYPHLSVFSIRVGAGMPALVSIRGGAHTVVNPRWCRHWCKSAVVPALVSIRGGAGTVVNPRWGRRCCQSAVGPALLSVRGVAGTVINSRWCRYSSVFRTTTLVPSPLLLLYCCSWSYS